MPACASRILFSLKLATLRGSHKTVSDKEDSGYEQPAWSYKKLEVCEESLKRESPRNYLASWSDFNSRIAPCFGSHAGGMKHTSGSLCKLMVNKACGMRYADNNARGGLMVTR